MRKIAIVVLGLSVVFLIAYIFYSGKTQVNSVTGKQQFVTLTPSEEVAAGLHSAPQLASLFGGLYRDRPTQRLVKKLGHNLVLSLADTNRLPYQFDFHVLTDSQTVNAFAMPGGQIFITLGMFRKLKTTAQLSGLLAHEIAHIVGRHTLEQVSRSHVFNGAGNSAAGSGAHGEISAYVQEIIHVTYDETGESETDALAWTYLVKAKHTPAGMTEAFEILSRNFIGDKNPTFATAHGVTRRRIEKLKKLP